MHLRALVAAVGLAVAFGTPPDLHNPVHAQQVELAPFSAQTASTYMTTLDTGRTSVQQLFDHVPTEAPDVIGEVQHFRVGKTDFYLVTPKLA